MVQIPESESCCCWHASALRRTTHAVLHESVKVHLFQRAAAAAAAAVHAHVPAAAARATKKENVVCVCVRACVCARA